MAGLMKALKKRTWWLLGVLTGLLLLATAAEKARQLVGDDASSKSGKFTWINCFDMGSGSLACIMKEGAKFYVYNIRAGHVERVRQRAYEVAYSKALADGLTMEAGAKQAQRAGKKAAKLASSQAQRIIGPISAAGWDSFEALYYGGTFLEAAMRGLGTICGTYVGGLQGENNLGRLGYLVGSHIGSWLGGRAGLMIYDIFSGIRFLTLEYPLETEPSMPSDDTQYLEYPVETEPSMPSDPVETEPSMPSDDTQYLEYPGETEPSMPSDDTEF